MKNSIAQARKVGIALAIAACCVAYTSAPASAGAQEDQQACMNDALTICSQFVPDRDRVASCLISNRSHISPACRMALTQFNPKMASTAKSAVRH
jgi:hypothetical protein